MMQLYFQNNYISLFYDTNNLFGKAVWRGHLQGAELKESYLMCQELVDRYELVRWLGDDRLMQTIDPADLEWSVQVIVPRLAMSSLQRMARLPSFSKENRKAIEVMIEKGHNLNTQLVLRDFYEEHEAMDWLMEEL